MKMIVSALVLALAMPALAQAPEPVPGAQPTATAPKKAHKAKKAEKKSSSTKAAKKKADAAK